MGRERTQEAMPKFSMDTLVGKKLLAKAGDDPKSTQTLMKDKKLVALYFSASWCPPCKAFSPVLKGFYETLGGQAKSNSFEIIYVSSDKTVEEFNGYYSTMPWLAIPPEEGSAAIKNTLAQTFGIRGIPTLIVMDAVTGEFVSASAREEVGAIKVKELAMCQQVLELWNAQERKPLSEAKSALDNVDGGPVMRFLMFFAKRPIYIFGLLYLYKYLTKTWAAQYSGDGGAAGRMLQDDPIPEMGGESEF